MVNLGSALLMQCSCDGCESECEVSGDLQVDQGVVLKLSYRPSWSGITRQVCKVLEEVTSEELHWQPEYWSILMPVDIY